MTGPTRTVQQVALATVLGLGMADLALLILVLGPALQRETERSRWPQGRLVMPAIPAPASSPATAGAPRAAVARQRPGPAAAPTERVVAVDSVAMAAAQPQVQAATAREERPASEPAATPLAGSAPAAAAAAPPPTLLFATGGVSVTARMRSSLRRVAVAMRAAGDLRLLCRGHADARGDAEANLLLSRRRADAVADLLVGWGVGRDRLTVEALGASEPVDPSSTPAAWARNRRVELRWR